MLLKNKIFHCHSMYMHRTDVRGEATIGHRLGRNLKQVGRVVDWVHHPLHSRSKNTVHAHFGINIVSNYTRFLFLSVEPSSGISIPSASIVGSMSASVASTSASGSYVCTLASTRRRYIDVRYVHIDTSTEDSRLWDTVPQEACTHGTLGYIRNL
jgi:hypothetical protein